MTSPEPDPLVEAVLATLEGNGWDYEVSDNDSVDGPLLRLVHDGTSARWVFYVHIEAGERYVAVYSVFPFDAPEEHRAATAELLTRINSGLVIGNFEIDLEDGEILGKTSLSAADDLVSTAAISRLVEANLEAMDRYFPAIAAVASGDMTPGDAFATVNVDARSPRFS